MVVKLYSHGRFDDVNIGSWSFLGFLFFIFLPGTGQATDSMGLKDHNPAGINKEGRGTHFPGN